MGLVVGGRGSGRSRNASFGGGEVSVGTVVGRGGSGLEFGTVGGAGLGGRGRSGRAPLASSEVSKVLLVKRAKKQELTSHRSSMDYDKQRQNEHKESNE